MKKLSRSIFHVLQSTSVVPDCGVHQNRSVCNIIEIITWNSSGKIQYFPIFVLQNVNLEFMADLDMVDGLVMWLR